MARGRVFNPAIFKEGIASENEVLGLEMRSEPQRDVPHLSVRSHPFLHPLQSGMLLTTLTSYPDIRDQKSI